MAQQHWMDALVHRRQNELFLCIVATLLLAMYNVSTLNLSPRTHFYTRILYTIYIWRLWHIS